MTPELGCDLNAGARDLNGHIIFKLKKKVVFFFFFKAELYSYWIIITNAYPAFSSSLLVYYFIQPSQAHEVYLSIGLV